MATNEKKKKATEDAETTQEAAQVNAVTVEQQDVDTTAEATQEAAQEEPAQADTATVPEAETNPETAPEELQGIAHSLMLEHGVSRVYRCPVNGYWFIREEYVNEYVKETGIEVKTYTSEVNVQDHDA